MKDTIKVNIAKYKIPGSFVVHVGFLIMTIWPLIMKVPNYFSILLKVNLSVIFPSIFWSCVQSDFFELFLILIDIGPLYGKWMLLLTLFYALTFEF